MDEQWERSLPLYPLAEEEALALMRRWDNGIQRAELMPIAVGCRNSNFHVTTERGEYLLRLCPPGTIYWRTEKAVQSALAESGIAPRLMACLEGPGNRPALIYEWIPSVSLLAMQRQGRIPRALIRQAAACAAVIHRTPPPEGMAAEPVPPIGQWTPLFLRNPRTKARLGDSLANRVRAVVDRHSGMLKQIDALQGLIHGDFRPANMIVDDRRRLYVADWEAARVGHILADIGQFFRYRRMFTAEDESVFDKAYQAAGGPALPPDWRRMSRLRDMMNPLQLLGVPVDAPRRDRDLVALVEDTVSFFESAEGK